MAANLTIKFHTTKQMCKNLQKCVIYKAVKVGLVEQTP